MATTLALGEQNHAEELKRVCLEFVSRNLGAVMHTEGYQHMIRSCPQLQARAPSNLLPLARTGLLGRMLPENGRMLPALALVLAQALILQILRVVELQHA